MKILLANKYFYLKGGAENSFFETARLLQERGHKISFFSMRGPHNYPSSYEKYFVSNVDYEREGLINKLNVSLKLLYSFEARKKIESLLLEENPDIAHLNLIYHQISPSVIHSLKKFKVPIIMSLRDYKLICGSYKMMRGNSACEACKNKKYFQCFLNKCVKGSMGKSLLNTMEMYLHHSFMKIYDEISVFISPSRFLKRKMEEMGFKGDIVYLPNFVDLDNFLPSYGCEEKSIIYFGRLSSEKGLFTLLEAVKLIPQIRLKIVGDGPLRTDLEALIEKERLKHVKCYGYLTGENLKREIHASSAVVLPSEWYENNPRSIIEGFALGKPAIGARIGGIPELVIDHRTGFTFEPGNARDLRDKILTLTKDPRMSMEFGRNAREFAKENLNAEIHYQKLMQVYKMAWEKER